MGDISGRTVLVTGGTGYIGSHTCVELLEEGCEVVVVDDLSNSSEKAIGRIIEIVGEEAGRRLSFHEVDILDRDALGAVFDRHPSISAVIHFAGKKAVGESVRMPLAYYRNNITGTLTLLDVMDEHGVRDIVFSSSATVYGDNDVPYVETGGRSG